MVKLEINGQAIACPTMPGQSGPFNAVRLTGRLRSTRGGRNFWWEKRKLKIDGAPFEPFINLEFRGQVYIRWLGWHSSQPEHLDDTRPLLAFGGTLTTAGMVISGNEVVDLSRKSERRETMNLLGEFEVIALQRQGHLEVRQLRLREGETLPGAEELWREKMGSSPIDLFNHSACLGERSFWGTRTLKCGHGNGMYVAVNIPEGGGGQITSPDHLLEAITLTPGLWLLFHPWPGDGRD